VDLADQSAVKDIDSNEFLRANRVLIVDDEALNRSLLSMVLTSSGFQCEEAVDGVAALEERCERARLTWSSWISTCRA